MVKVSIDKEAVDLEDIEMLEDLIMAATNEALRKATEAAQSSMPNLGNFGGDYHSNMDYYSTYITKLISELQKLPGIGTKSAQRLAFHIINMQNEQVLELANSMIQAKEKVNYCKSCCTLTDADICPICASTARNHKLIMVVENTRDLMAYEKTAKYDGLYHVLHGAISPMLGIGPADIKLRELMLRLEKDVDELIIATNSTVEGEATAMYISKLAKPAGIKVTRIASGVPVGGDLEYIDEVTLLRALEGRVEL